MNIPWIIFPIIIGGVLLASAAIVFVQVFTRVISARARRITKNSPPPPPFKCPACGSGQMDVFTSGLWDGVDEKGRGTGGMRQVGTCTNCHVHCVYYSIWDSDTDESRYESRVLTDEEWQQETGSIMKLQRKQAQWPFTSEDLAT